MKRFLYTFMALLAVHWLEHVLQAVQIFVLGWPRSRALGAVGYVYPWLVHSEALHLGFGILTAACAGLLLPYFRNGGGYGWWVAAYVLALIHVSEHVILLMQAGMSVPLPRRMGLLGRVVPRVELHLFYNAVVTLPMLMAMWRHGARPARPEALPHGELA